MTVLDRYIARNFTYSFIIALAVMIAMIVGLDLMINLDEFTEDRSLTTLQVLANLWDFYGHQFFFYYSQLAGLLAIIAAAVTVGRMTRANELTALLASGVPLQRILLPIGACAAVVALLWGINAEMIIPKIADKLTREHDDVGGRRTFEIGIFREIVAPSSPTAPRVDLLYSASGFNPFRSPATLNGLTVICRENGKATWNIRADRAWWNPDRQAWQLDRGIKFSPPMTSAVVDPEEVSQQVGTIRHDEVEELRSTLTPQEMKLRKSTQWIRFLSVDELRDMWRRPDISELQQKEIQRCLHERFAQPLIAVLCALVASALYLKKGPSNLIVQTSKVLGLCGLIFIVQFVFRAGQGTDVAFSAWLPLIMAAGTAGWVIGNVKT